MTDNIYSNSLVLKIANGTPRSDENLCRTCRNCQISRGASSGRESYRCFANYNHPVMLREAMCRCSFYSDARRPTLDQMAQIAWSLMTDKGGRSIGFLSPEELREREQRGAPMTTPRVGF